MKKLIAYIRSEEFLARFKGERLGSHNYTDGMDFADSIALIVICALLMFVVIYA